MIPPIHHMNAVITGWIVGQFHAADDPYRALGRECENGAAIALCIAILHDGSLMKAPRFGTLHWAPDIQTDG